MFLPLTFSVVVFAVYASQSLEDRLLQIRDKLLNLEVSPFYRGHPNEELIAFTDNFFSEYTENLPVLIIHEENMSTDRWGNRFGKYFHDLGCAYLSGAHIIHLKASFHPYREEDRPGASVWFERVPAVIVHESPAESMMSSIEKFHNVCKIHPYPWDNGDDDVLAMVPILRSVFLAPIEHVMARTETTTSLKLKESMMKWSEVDYNQNLVDSYNSEVMSGRTRGHLAFENDLTMYPDVSIHYRCSDNVFFRQMGLTHFTSILRRIPSNAKYIYILTEPYTRVSPSGIVDEKELCQHVLEALHSDITSHFPEAHVVTRHGGDIFTTLAMLSHSPTTICSISTFCFYAALCNVHGQVVAVL